MTPATASKNPPTENLALIYQESLTSIVRLRCGRQAVSDAQFFRGQFRESLRLAQDASRQRGYNDEDSKDARFAVVAFLDESILNIRTAVFADWVRKPLQEELFGVHVGGEVFYQNLERLMTKQDSAVLADVLEVYLLCLLLGYQGRYSVPGKRKFERSGTPCGRESAAFEATAGTSRPTGSHPLIKRRGKRPIRGCEGY